MSQPPGARASNRPSSTSASRRWARVVRGILLAQNVQRDRDVEQAALLPLTIGQFPIVIEQRPRARDLVGRRMKQGDLGPQDEALPGRAETLQQAF